MGVSGMRDAAPPRIHSSRTLVFRIRSSPRVCNTSHRCQSPLPAAPPRRPSGSRSNPLGPVEPVAAVRCAGARSRRKPRRPNPAASNAAHLPSRCTCRHAPCRSRSPQGMLARPASWRRGPPCPRSTPGRWRPGRRAPSTPRSLTHTGRAALRHTHSVLTQEHGIHTALQRNVQGRGEEQRGGERGEGQERERQGEGGREEGRGGQRGGTGKGGRRRR